MTQKPNNTQEAALSTVAVTGTHPRRLNRSVKLICWGPPDLQAGLRRLAEENGTSLSFELRRAVRTYLRLLEPDDVDP